MFAGLADLITKRYKLIIIAWIVALLIAIPFAPLATGVVQYEETEMAPADLESSIANQFISDNFGSLSDQPTTLIVLTSSNVMDQETKNVVLNIQKGIADAYLNGDMDKVEVTSIYSVTEKYTLNVIKALNSAYVGANQTALLIFGVPQEYRALWAEVNRSAGALYGIPEGHVQTWEGIAAADSTLTVQQVDDLAYQTFRAQLDFQAQGLGPEQQAFMLGWYQAFMGGWNETADQASQPSQRASTAHSAAFPAFLDGLPMAEEEKLFLDQVNSAFASSPVDFANVSGLTKQVFEQNIASMTSGMPAGQASLVGEYLNATYAWWTSLGTEPSDQQFEAGVMAVSLTFGESIPDQATRDMFLGVRSALGGLAGYNDAAMRSASLSQVIASMPSVANTIAPQPWVVAEAGAMGEFDAIKALELSRSIVANSSLSDFPIKIPSDIIGQLVSPDNSTMLMTLTFAPVEDNSNPGRSTLNTVRGITGDSIAGTSVRSYVTGTDALNADMETSTFEDLAIIEPITIILVLVLIGLFFRSFVASSIPPMAIGIALAISYAAVFFIGAYVMSIHYSVLTLMLTAMMGAGCDYCIFILSRYREERKRGRNKNDAVHQAVTWAGESIATSGATVIIGFGVLSIGQFSLMQSMGITISIGITVALLVALTLLPSVLMLLGDRIFWPAKMDRPEKVRTKPTYFTRTAKFSIKHAKVILIAAVLISIPTTYLALSVDTSYDFIGQMADTESKQGLNVLQDGFGGGKITPTQVAVQMDSAVLNNGTFDATAMAAIEDLSSTMAGLENVKQLTGPTRPYGVPIDYANSTLMSEYSAIIGNMVSEDGRSVLLTVTFEAEPFDMSSIDTIQVLRDVASENQGTNGISQVLVGGATASMFDISVMTQEDFGTMAILVVVGIYLVLMFVLGSMINPLRSILTILLSISWTLAVTLLLFQDVLGQPILYMVPLILLLVCMGLGMDYDILLTTRVREEVAKGKSNNEAIVYAVEQTGAIITACGIIMAAAFGSMMLSNGFLLKQFGFALMFAILLDAIIVRMYMVPAIMSLLGKWNWWAPGPLRRMNEKRNRKRVEALTEAEAGLRPATEAEKQA
ncbi:MAG: MMPL family transporter [Methanomassiliicoccus sp.]|nr:MMPL family transporter [Methanomassiliicoccus sp.]